MHADLNLSAAKLHNHWCVYPPPPSWVSESMQAKNHEVSTIVQPKTIQKGRMSCPMKGMSEAMLTLTRQLGVRALLNTETSRNVHRGGVKNGLCSIIV